MSDFTKKLMKSATLTIKNSDVAETMNIEPLKLPVYDSPIFNLVNRFAQATRKKLVGCMTDLMNEFISEYPRGTVRQWRKWYLERYPDAIHKAAKKIQAKMAVMGIMPRPFRRIVLWVHDLIIVKTYTGLHRQRAILKFVSMTLGVSYRASTEEEESRGIDGWISGIPVSIKADTYRFGLSEKLPEVIIIYSEAKTADNETIVYYESIAAKIREIAA